MSITQLIFLLSSFVLLCHSQPIRGNGVDRRELDPVSPTSPRFLERRRRNCRRLKFRTLEGTCSSIGSPERQLWGSAGRPHFSYFNINSKEFKADALPNPRLISNMLCRQDGDTQDERGLSEMVTFFGQFLDHTIVATPTNKDEKMNIPIPRDDPIFANFSKGELPFSRSVRVNVDAAGTIQRPQNTLSSVVDLASVYGPNKIRNDALRAFRSGLLKTSGANLLPLNADRVNNAPITGRKFFLAGDHRANEHPVLLSLHTLFMREHNDIAKELLIEFPEWTDEEIYLMARKINIAQMQKITFEQWYPAIVGEKLPPYTGYKRTVDPTVSVLFSTAAFRVGHTLVGNQVNRVGRRRRKLSPFNFMNIFFSGTATMKRLGIDDFIRGALLNNAQKIDLKIVSALRNFLFTRIKQEDAFDLAANNLQRCRDHNCPSYKEIRRFFRRGRSRNVRRFTDITKDIGLASRMQSVYGNVRKVDAWIGLIAEDHEPNSSFGATMKAVWKQEFRRLRDGDRFHFRADGHFPEEVRKLQRVKDVLDEKFDVFRAIIQRNTRISRADLPKKTFFVD